MIQYPGNPQNDSFDEQSAEEPSYIKVAHRLGIKTEDGDDPEHEFEDPDIYVPSVWQKILDKGSQWLSWILVPLFMPVYGLWMIFGLSYLKFTPLSSKITVTLAVAALCVALPMLFILLLKVLGRITDVGLNRRRQRFIPYLFTALCMAAAGWFVASRGAPMWVSMFFVGGAVSGIVNTIINLWWKISAHAAGVAGMVAILLRIARDGVPQGNLELWLIIWLILAGMLGSSRLWLRRHTLGQVLGGYASGFFGVFLMTMIR